MLLGVVGQLDGQQRVVAAYRPGRAAQQRELMTLDIKVTEPEALAILDSGSKDDAPEAARENRDQPLEALEADRITPQGSEFDDVQEESEASQDTNDTNELLKLAGGG